MREIPQIVLTSEDLTYFNQCITEGTQGSNHATISAFDADEYQVMRETLLRHYSNAVEYLKQNELDKLLLELKKAGSKILTALAEKMPNLQFVQCYSYLIKFLLEKTFTCYENNFGTIRAALTAEAQSNLECLEYAIIEQEGAFCREHITNYEKNPFASSDIFSKEQLELQVRYFIYKPLIINFIPDQERGGKTHASTNEKLKGTDVSDRLMSFIKNSAPIDEIDQKIIEKIKKQLISTQEKLQQTKVIPLNIFVKNTVEKAAQLGVLIETIGTMDTLSTVHAAFKKICSNKNMKHRNFFLRCASRLFPCIPAPTTTQELKRIEASLPDLTELVSAIPH